jgi:hypothetical protein
MQHFSDCNGSAIFRISSKQVVICTNSYQHRMQFDLFRTSSKLWRTWVGVQSLQSLHYLHYLHTLHYLNTPFTLFALFEYTIYTIFIIWIHYLHYLSTILSNQSFHIWLSKCCLTIVNHVFWRGLTMFLTIVEHVFHDCWPCFLTIGDHVFSYIFHMKTSRFWQFSYNNIGILTMSKFRLWLRCGTFQATRGQF